MGAIVANTTLRARLALAVGAAALVTLGARVTPAATPSPAFHVAVETTATVIAVLSASVVYARLRRSAQRSDLALSAAFAVFAARAICVSVVPVFVTGLPERPMAWGAVLAQFLGAALLAAAALMPIDEAHRPAFALRPLLAGGALSLAAIAAAVLIDHGQPPRSAYEPAFVVQPAVVALEAAIVVLHAAAALGFARRAAMAHDGLMTWLAIAAVFGCFTGVSYVADPSMPTRWFPAGDVLRLAFCLCVLAGGVAEIRRARRARTAAAIDEERRRIARDLHDGTAQDLAFILHLARRLTERAGRPHELRQLAAAARHALDNTRYAMGETARSGDEPLAPALRRTAQEVAQREGARADVEIGLHVSVPAATRDALCLLLREAVTNAVRHGGARTVRVSVANAPGLRLSISDDGRGFDADQALQSTGRFGLRGMQQRVGDLGGNLRITSQPGLGTEVLVVLP